MANPHVIITVDASQMIKYIRLGMENMFIALSDFSELERELNLNKIDFDGEEDK